MVSSTGLNHLISFYKKVQVHFGQNNNLTEELYDFRKVIEDAFGTNSLFTGNYHTTTIDGEVGVREYIIKRIGNDWDKERLGKEGFSIYETKILAGEKNE